VLLLKVSTSDGLSVLEPLVEFDGASAVSAAQEGPSGTEYVAVASVDDNGGVCAV